MNKGPNFYYWIFLLLLAALAVTSFGKFRFLSRAVRTEGEVTRVEASNLTCGEGGKRRRRYPCTRFTGVVKFHTADGEQYGLTVTAGEKRGHDRPVSESNLYSGQSYRVVYDPRRPQTAYPDSFFGVWGNQALLAVSAFIFLIMSVARRNRGRY